MKKIKFSELRELINKANSLKHEFMNSGLLKTYHQMDEVTKAIGWEASEIIEGKHPTKIDDESS